VSYQKVARIASKLNKRRSKYLGYRIPAKVLASALRFNQ